MAEQRDPSSGSTIALLTTGGDYAGRILAACADRGVEVSVVLMVGPAQGSKSLPAKARETLRRRGLMGLLSAGSAKVGSRLTGAAGASFSDLAGRVVSAGPLNGPAMIEALEAAAPDYLVLGGVGIVGEAALAIPAAGTLNAHPGLLPFARGVGVVARSVERRVPVGATLHFVDKGIDTGQVIRRALVPVGESESLESLGRKAYSLCVELMGDAVAAAAGGTRLEGTRQTLRFPLCDWPTGDEEREISRKVSDGLALDLYERWSDFYGADELPDEVEPYPDIGVEAE